MIATLETPECTGLPGDSHASSSFSPERPVAPMGVNHYDASFQETIGANTVTNELIAVSAATFADKIEAVRQGAEPISRTAVVGAMFDLVGAADASIKDENVRYNIRRVLADFLNAQPITGEDGQAMPVTFIEARQRLLEETMPGRRDILGASDFIELTYARTLFNSLSAGLWAAPRQYGQASQMRLNTHALKSMDAVASGELANSQPVQEVLLDKELKKGVVGVGQILVSELAALDPRLEDIRYMHQDLRDQDGKLKVSWVFIADGSSAHRRKGENHSEIKINPQTVEAFNALFANIIENAGLPKTIDTEALALEYIAAHELGHAVSARFGSEERLSGRWIKVKPETVVSKNIDDATTIEEESFAEGCSLLVLNKLLTSKYGANPAFTEIFINGFMAARVEYAQVFVDLLHGQDSNTPLKEVADDKDAAAYIGYSHAQSVEQLRERMLFILGIGPDILTSEPALSPVKQDRSRFLGRLSLPKLRSPRNRS